MKASLRHRQQDLQYFGISVYMKLFFHKVYNECFSLQHMNLLSVKEGRKAYASCRIQHYSTTIYFDYKYSILSKCCNVYHGKLHG